MKLSAIVLFFCFFMSAATAAPINQVVVFGDSLSDTGNLYAYMQHQFPPSPPYYEGRASNGPLWIEHVLAHYYPNDRDAHVLNYACGGTGVEDEDDDEDGDDVEETFMFSLGAQVKAYLRSVDKQANASSLYVVWTGANNYTRVHDHLDEEVNFTISGIKRSLEMIVEAGAKHIMVTGLPNIGISPKAREFNNVDQMHYVSNQHNMKLEAEIETFRLLYPDIEWLYFDVNQIFLTAVNHPEHYGLTNVADSCRNMETVLSHCDTYLFFDASHPSARAHQYIGKSAIALLDKAGIEFG